MQKVTLGYEPKDALGYFEAISAIPRGSFNEKAVAEYIYNWGKSLGLDSYMDEDNNVVIKKPATKGYEHAAPILLQGHTDIVCVKLPDSNHNFETDPLPLYIEDGKLKSKGTTLGADNGNAVSYMMAVLSRDNIIHPPVECVFTATEEVGLIGANALDKNSFTAKRMINMDAGGLDSSITTVSCAGGLELKMHQQPKWVDAEGSFLTITISGLQGGHSAGAIDLGRGNAAKLMGRMINHLSLVTPTTVSGFFGGEKMNAIVSACTATISVANKELALSTLAQSIEEIKEELRVTDSGFTCTVEEVEAPAKMLCPKQSKRLVQFIVTMPSTMRDKSFEIEGHVLNSNNLGAVQISEEDILLWTLARSGDDSRMNAMGEEIKALADVFGYEVEVCSNFSGWKYNPVSPLRDAHKELFLEKFGAEIKESATHGGLECGCFYAKEPEMDIITLGPRGSGAHTPEEYVILASFDEMFNYLLALLEKLAKA